MSILIPLIQKIFLLDPDHTYLVDDLHGKKFGVSISNWNLHFTLVPEEKSIKVIRGNDDADVSITGSLADFLTLKDMQSKQAAFSKSSLEIKGDIRVLTLYQAFFDRLELDWTQALAYVLGDKPATFLAKPLSIFGKVLKRQADITKQNLPEILQEEKQLLPPRAEVEDFFAEIRKLQMDVERLEARIKPL